MNMNTVAKELAWQAKAKGICQEWHKELIGLTDKRAMVDMYIRGIDFCLANDFPSNDYIRATFKGVMEDKGVFLDDKVNLANVRYCVALGTTQGEVRVTGYKVCEVFAKHQSSLHVIAEDNAFVEIDMFDDSVVSVTSAAKAKVHVNRYGGTLSIVQSGGGVKVIEKNKKTYT